MKGCNAQTVSVSVSFGSRAPVYSQTHTCHLNATDYGTTLMLLSTVMQVPVLGHYEGAGVVARVDANTAPDAVWHSVAAALPK